MGQAASGDEPHELDITLDAVDDDLVKDLSQIVETQEATKQQLLALLREEMAAQAEPPPAAAVRSGSTRGGGCDGQDDCGRVETARRALADSLRGGGGGDGGVVTL